MNKAKWVRTLGKPTCWAMTLICLSATALPAQMRFPQATVKPDDIVLLREVDPTIQQDLRYAGWHNFVGKPLPGYENAECWLTRRAANRLKQVQAIVRASGYSLKVYDCYRPTRTVDAFVAWGKQPNDTLTKAEFYPTVNKQDVFKLGYVANRSTHSRASTVDITLVRLPTPAQPVYQPEQSLTPCTASYAQRYADNSIDMGTGFDCFDKRSHPNNRDIGLIAQHHRQMFIEVMSRHGFKVSPREWWHFTLNDEPYPRTYFNF